MNRIHFCSVPNLSSELFTLQPNFTPIQTTHTVPNNTAWGGRHHIHTHNEHQGKHVVTVMPSSLLSCCYGNLWTSGDLLKPAPPIQIHSPGAPLHSGKMLPSDLDSSLANLVGSECADIPSWLHGLRLSGHSALAVVFPLSSHHLSFFPPIRPAVWGDASQKVSGLYLPDF